MSLINELKRRNVFKVGAAYLALGWVVVQATATLAPAFHLPASTLPLVTWIGVIGFPFVVVFSWVYELTPEGLKRESEVDRSQSITHLTSKRLDYIIIGMLAVAIGLFAFHEFRPTRSEAPEQPPVAETTPAPAATTQPPAAAGAPAIAADDKSIAVLPFTDMSAAKDQEYMSDGIAEELLNLLANIPELQVAARTSSFSYKGKDTRIAQIAQELHVAHVLEGSVRKSSNTLRITAQLIRAADGYHLWSASYDRTLDDIFVVQDEIADAVVEQLKIKLLGAPPKAKEVNPEAYALFLQARQLRRQNTQESYAQAIELNQQALALDPDYAAALHELAVNYVNQANAGQRPTDEAYTLARESVNKALTADPNFARGYDGLAWFAMTYDGDLAAAARHLEHALALEPANPAIVGDAASLAGSLGRLDNAIELGQWSLAHDPLNPVASANQAGRYLAAGRMDDAIASVRAVLRLSPGYIGAYAYLGIALLRKGETEDALTEMQKEPDEVSRLFGLALVYHAQGKRAESDAALARLIAEYEKQASFTIASVLAYRSEADRAFEWLEKAVAQHDVGLSDIPINALFANLYDDPRWLPFLRKIGKAPEQLAAIKFEVKLPQQ